MSIWFQVLLSPFLLLPIATAELPGPESLESPSSGGLELLDLEIDDRESCGGEKYYIISLLL
jgi:hypothetical protein